MREHFYHVVLTDKKIGREILNVDFGKSRVEALALFYDLSFVVKKTRAKLVLYEDKGTSNEKEYLVMQQGGIKYNNQKNR